MNIDLSQILSQIIAFLITLWVLKRFAWQPLLGVMDERRRKIKAEFDSIENQKSDVRKLADEYNDKLLHAETFARVKIQEAIEEGRKASQEIQNEAHNQAREILNKTQEEAKREIEKAKIQLKNDMVKSVIEATDKLIKEKLDEKKHKQLIEEFIKEAEVKK